MTSTVPGMRSNKLVSMDIDQLRGWATAMDRAMIASLVAVVIAVAALGITTWLSFRFGGAVRSREQATLEQYKAAEGQSAQREREVAAARERAATLEQEVSAARDKTLALEQEASTARERAAAFEQASREANERAARAARESAATREKAPAPQFDAAEIQQRLADLGKLVREAAARPANPAPEAPRPVEAQGAPESAVAVPEQQVSPVVATLRKYAGTKAAVFVVQPISDAQAAGAAISALLGDAGWAPGTWTWTGVAGIFGVVVLIKEGSDPATNEAASAVVEALRSAGFNATKGDWPASWSRFRGMLDGPQTPGPTEASIRIVIGAKPR